MGKRHDTAVLKAALPVARYCERVGIKLVKAGAEMRGACPFCKVKGRKPFAVRDDGWRCNACEMRGDVIRLVANVEDIEMGAAMARVAELANIDEDDPSLAARSEVIKADAKAKKATRALERAQAIANAPEYWRKSERRSDAGRAYLAARGVDAVHSEVRYRPGAICVPLRAADGTIVNVVRRRYEGEGPKTPSLRNCPTLGTFGNLADAALTTGPVVVVEGVFDWLSARAAIPSALVLGAHGAGRWPNVVSMACAVAAERGLLVVPHMSDTNKIGARKVAQAIDVARAAGVTEIQRFDLASGDLNDWLLAGGTGAELLAAPLVPDDTQRVYALSDLGNADRFADLHKDSFRYLAQAQEWLGWDGKTWAPAFPEVHLVRAVRRVTEQLNAEAHQGAKYSSWAEASQGSARVNAMVSFARADTKLEATSDELNANDYLLCCDNGTIDLHTGELLPHRRDDLITMRSPVAYDPDALAPTWARFISQVFEPVPDAAEFVQRYAGYTLTGDTSGQCLLFAHGAGSNGKGVLFRVMQSLLGDAMSGTLPMELFVQRAIKKTNEAYQLASCARTRAVFVSEGKKGERLDNETVNKMTGQDTLPARLPHGRPFTYRPNYKLWMTSNWLPGIDADDYALWRRFKIVPFLVRFEGAARDDGLGAKLAAELPGILAWAVRGCLEWKEAGGGLRGLGESVSIAAATAGHQAYSDDLGRFLEECCASAALAQAQGMKAITSAVYARYQKWCKSQGAEAMSAKAFGAEMGQRDLGSVKSGGRRWYPVGLQSDG